MIKKWERFCGGLCFRKLMFEFAGEKIPVHAHHNFHHVTQCTAGSVAVYIDDERHVLSAMQEINIAKDAKHHIEALEANSTAQCIFHARDEKTGEVLVDPNNWYGAMA